MLLVMVLWVLALAVTWWWLASQAAQPAAETGPPPDPHAAEVARFRAELHDWDRGQ